MHKLKKISLVIIISVLFTSLLISSCAQQYFYYPDQVDYGYHPDGKKQAYEKVKFESLDGTQLVGWFIPSTQHQTPKEAFGTVIHLHGNAANITAHYALIDWLPEQGFNVLTFDYRGFGNSKGKPNFKGVFEDTNSAINFARQYPQIDPKRLLILSQSLGGNNAISAIGSGNKQGVQAIVVDSTFYSYSSIANEKLKGSGIFISDQYAASRYVAQLTPIPVLFLHGAEDKVIPTEHTKKLFEKANTPKELIIIPNGQHITGLLDPNYQKIVTQFYLNALNHPQQK